MRPQHVPSRPLPPNHTPMHPPLQCRLAEAGGAGDSLVRLYAREASTLLLDEVDKYTTCGARGGGEGAHNSAVGRQNACRRPRAAASGRVQQQGVGRLT